MRYKLTKEEIESYRENGFVVIHDFLNTEEVETWRTSIDTAIENRAGRKFPHSEIKTGESDGINKDANYFGKVFDQIINLWQTDEAVKKIMLDKRLGEMAANLAQVDGIRIWHDQSLVKRPWANPTAWHLDTPFWSFNNREALSIWVALDDVTMQNGCMYFMPGSHKETSLEDLGIGTNLGDVFNKYPKYGHREPVKAEIKAGSCTFHNGLCLHGAGVNMTPGLRRAMTCAYMPDGSIFNGKKNVIPDEKFEKLAIGDLMNDDEQNPLIYHKNWA